MERGGKLVESRLSYCLFALMEMFKTKTMPDHPKKHRQTKGLLTRIPTVFLNFTHLKNWESYASLNVFEYPDFAAVFRFNTEIGTLVGHCRGYSQRRCEAFALKSTWRCVYTQGAHRQVKCKFVLFFTFCRTSPPVKLRRDFVRFCMGTDLWMAHTTSKSMPTKYPATSLNRESNSLLSSVARIFISIIFWWLMAVQRSMILFRANWQ